MADKGWRSFAGEFAGSGDIRFEQFQATHASAGSNTGMINMGHLTSDLQKVFEGLGPKDGSQRQEKLQTLRRKLRDQTERQKKIEERRKARDREMAEEWQKHMTLVKEEKVQERHMRLAALREKQQRMEDAKAERQAEIEAEEARKEDERREAELQAEEEALRCFLTGMGTVKIADTEPQEEKAPEPVKKSPSKQKAKARLPSEAMGSRKKKIDDTGGVKISDKSTLIQQLPQLFPGLKRNAEGQQILANAENTAKEFAAPSSTQGPLLRSAQIGVMTSLASQVSEYRKSIRGRLKPLDNRESFLMSSTPRELIANTSRTSFMTSGLSGPLLEPPLTAR